MYSDVSECICYADSKYRIWTVVKIQNGWLVITLLTLVFFNYVLNLSNIDSFLALSFQEKACLEGFFFFFFEIQTMVDIYPPPSGMARVGNSKQQYLSRFPGIIWTIASGG